MALWDKEDLLLRCKDMLMRPTSDLVFTDVRLYRYLTAAEDEWKPIVARHYPEEMWAARTILTTSDSKTFTLPSGAASALDIVIYESLKGRVLIPGDISDPGADYVLQSGSILMTADRKVTFSDGPYARWIAEPVAIDASTDSTISPSRLRILLVYAACALAARSGGVGDPSYYEEKLDEAAWGNAQTGNVGLLGNLKASGPGYSYHGTPDYAYWRGH